jgi:hypothetical protein
MSTNVNHPLDFDFVVSFAMRWGEVWATRDAEGLAALCTEDVEFTDPALGTVRGRAAVAEWLRGCERAFPDYRFDDPEEPPYLAPDSPKAIVLAHAGHALGADRPAGHPADQPLVRHRRRRPLDIPRRARQPLPRLLGLQRVSAPAGDGAVSASSRLRGPRTKSRSRDSSHEYSARAPSAER